MKALMGGNWLEARALIVENQSVAGAESVAFRSIGGSIIDLDDVAACLSADGIVVFARACRTLVADVLGSWTVARAHPHAGGGALTSIEPRAATTGPGNNGFSHEAVAPHTDRALVPEPPSLVAVLVEQPASTGGHSLLVDLGADRWFRLLARSRPAASGLWLRAGDGMQWPVVEAARGLARVRLRDDALAQPAHGSARGRMLLTRLRTLSARPTVLGLGAGEGYLVHNHRVLHGRTAFVGYRRVVRFLADVRPEHRFAWLNDGFALSRR